MRLITACATGERSTYPHVWPGRLTSSAKRPVPVSRRGSSRRGSGAPMPCAIAGASCVRGAVSGAEAEKALRGRAMCDPSLLLALVGCNERRRAGLLGHHRRVLTSDLGRVFLQHARHVLSSCAERDLLGTAFDRFAQ